MDHGHGYFNLGATGFWLFIAVVIAVGAWEKARRNAERHETLRRIIEKTGTVDESRLKELLGTEPSSDWMKSTPGDGYRALRVAGIIIMGLAAGLALFFLALGQTEVISHKASTIGLAASGAVAIFGVGFFFSSRFTERPPGQGNGSAR